MGELLRLRLGPMGSVAVLATVGFIILRIVYVALERAGKIPDAADPSRRSLRTDLAFMLLSPLTEVVSKVVTTLAVVACGLAIGKEVGPELLQGFGPVARQPRWLIIVEMLVLSDFIYYWVHRSAHTYSVLWRLHAVHHSTRHLRWTSALRAHPAETYLHVILAVPLFFVGFPVDALAVVAPITLLYSFIIHTNANFSAGPLSYVLNSPRFHAWHHSLEFKGVGSNFAGYFPFIDRLFGSWHMPDHNPPTVGIHDDVPETCLAQIKYPFRREREARPTDVQLEQG
jgi:sterol desaturase/sphingolipid hydroxylase (fatty acid hydroxylase superfamily)